MSSDTLKPLTSKMRVHVWDNYKALLIFLVIFGHVISTIRNVNPVLDGLYDFIYLFHMPAMILVSGLFVKEVLPSFNSVAKNITSLLAVWVICELLWVAMRLSFGNIGISSSFLVIPSWTLWFLVSLFTMRLLLPYILWFKYPLLLTIGVALIAGFSSQIGSEFSISRTLTFLPFFVLGYKLRNESFGGVNWFNHKFVIERTPIWLKISSAVVLVTSVVLVYLNSRNEWFESLSSWLLWRNNYSDFYDNLLIAPLIKAVLLLFGLILLTALFFLTPKNKTWLTSFGEKTLYIYLLHSFVIYVLREAGLVDDWAENYHVLVSLTIFTLLSVVIFFLTGNKYVTSWFRVLFEPQWLTRLQSPRFDTK